MNIIILGAGQVGSSVARELARDDFNEITVVDVSQPVLDELQERMDIRTVRGNGSYPSVLEQAGIDDADLLIALTNSDEINMVACQVAWTLFNTPLRVARIRSQDYMQRRELFHEEDGVPVSVTISPENLVTEYIHHLIEHPSALQVLDFAGGRVQLVAVRAYADGPLVGHPLRDIRRHIPGIDVRVAAIFRGGQAVAAEADTVIEPDDEVFFIAARKHISRVIAELRRLDKPIRKVMLAGGGSIGGQLAALLERRYQVKVIEMSPERADELSRELNNTLVLQGDAANPDLLEEENIEAMDVFCALTNDDEANILSAMLAKRMGARKAMSLINRPAYVDLVESDMIDIAVSPHQVTIGAMLANIRRGDVVAVHALRRGSAEAIEAVAHGTRKDSKVVGRRLDELKLPRGSVIGAIVRGEQVLIAHHDTVIEPDDHVIIFLTDKRQVHEVEKLFQPKATFL